VCEPFVGGEQSLVDVEVALRHHSIAEARFEFFATSATSHLRYPRNGLHHLPFRLTEKPRHPMAEDLGYRASTPCDHRSPAGQGLDHHQTERLRPVDREQQCPGTAEQLRLGTVADLAEVLDVRHRLEKRTD